MRARMLDTHAVARSLADAAVDAGPRRTPSPTPVRLAVEQRDHVTSHQFTARFAEVRTEPARGGAAGLTSTRWPPTPNLDTPMTRGSLDGINKHAAG